MKKIGDSYNPKSFWYYMIETLNLIWIYLFSNIYIWPLIHNRKTEINSKKPHILYYIFSEAKILHT